MGAGRKYFITWVEIQHIAAVRNLKNLCTAVIFIGNLFEYTFCLEFLFLFRLRAGLKSP